MKLSLSFLLLSTFLLQVFATSDHANALTPSLNQPEIPQSSYTDVLARSDLIARLRNIFDRRDSVEDTVEEDEEEDVSRTDAVPFWKASSSSEGVQHDSTVDILPDSLVTQIRQTVSSDQMSRIRAACRRCFTRGGGRRNLCVRALTLEVVLARQLRRGNTGGANNTRRSLNRLVRSMRNQFGATTVNNGFACAAGGAPQPSTPPRCPDARRRVLACKSIEQNALGLFLILQKKLRNRFAESARNMKFSLAQCGGTRCVRILFDFQRNGLNSQFISALRVIVNSNINEFSSVFVPEGQWRIRTKRIGTASGGRKIRYIINIRFLSSYLNSQ